MKGINLKFLALLLMTLAPYFQAQGQNDEEAVEELGKSIHELEKSYYKHLPELKKMNKERLEQMTETINGVKDSIGLSPDTSGKAKDTGEQTGKNTFQISTDGIEINFDSESDSCKSEGEALENVEFDYLNFDLGFNNYLQNNDFQMPSEYNYLEVSTGKSLNVQLTFVKMGVSLIDHHLSLMTGIGIDYNNYRYENDHVLLSDTDNVLAEKLQEGYDKYKLTTQYAFMPLALRYETNPEDHGSSFRVALGGRAGYLIKSYTKLKDNSGDKSKDFDDFNLRKYKFGLTGRIGYGHLNLYANYDISGLFQDDKGPELNPVAFGITLNGFQWD